ncbi:RNA helicase [Plasmodiophora brassicae]
MPRMGGVAVAAGWCLGSRVARTFLRRMATAADRASFAGLGLNTSVCDALTDMKIATPTWIQAEVIPRVLARKDVLLADQTGTGKTLAYLAPVMQLIKNIDADTGVMACAGKPRGVVVVPSRELAVQVANVAKMLSHHLKLSVRVMLGGAKIRVQRSDLSSPIDLVIGTPGRIRKLVYTRDCRLGDVQFVVIDEADTLFDPKCGFLDELDAGLLTPVRNLKAKAKGGPVQFILVSATMRQQVVADLQAGFPGIETVLSQKLHRLPSAMTVDFVGIGARDKVEVLVSTLRQMTTRPIHDPVVIFCNTTDSCRAVDHALHDSGFSNTACLHGDILPKTRRENFTKFTSGEKSILVTSDVAFRGLDFPTKTRVVMFDFPLNPCDFLHRAGRTARAGSTGVVVAFVSKRDQVLARAIKNAMARGESIESLSSSASDYKRAPSAKVVYSPRKRDGPVVFSGNENRFFKRPKPRPVEQHTKRDDLSAKSSSTRDKRRTRDRADGEPPSARQRQNVGAREWGAAVGKAAAKRGGQAAQTRHASAGTQGFIIRRQAAQPCSSSLRPQEPLHE